MICFFSAKLYHHIHPDGLTGSTFFIAFSPGMLFSLYAQKKIIEIFSSIVIVIWIAAPIKASGKELSDFNQKTYCKWIA